MGVQATMRVTEIAEEAIRSRPDFGRAEEQIRVEPEGRIGLLNSSTGRAETVGANGSIDDFQAKLDRLDWNGEIGLVLAHALPEQVLREWDQRQKARIADRRYVEGQVGLVSYKQRRPKRPSQGRAITAADPRRPTEVLAGIPAEVYIPALTDSEVFPGGGCNCPLPDHDDLNPSASVKDAVWYCHRCGEGGGIFQLGSALSGLRDRGDQFFELRKWLAERLLGAAA